MTHQKGRPRSHKRPPVFLDPQQRRGHWLKILAGMTGFALLAWLTTVALGVYYLDLLPESEKLASVREGALLEDTAVEGGPLPQEPARCPLLPWAIAPPGPVAYLRNARDLDTTTLQPNCTPLSGLLVEALEIDAAAQTVGWLDKPSLDASQRILAGSGPAPALDLVALLPLPPMPDGGASLLDDADTRGRIVSALAETVAGQQATGLCLDPDQFSFGHLDGLRQLMFDLRNTLPVDMATCLVADAEGPLWRDAGLIDAVDRVVLRAFQFPDAGAVAGPLAPQAWFDTLIADALAAMGPDKLQVALGSFGYLWSDGAQSDRPLSFVEAMDLASRHKAEIAVDPASLNTRIHFVDAAGNRSEIWVLDVVSLHNQLLSLTRQGVPHRLLWWVGQEDPAAWPLLAKGAGPTPPGVLEDVAFPDVVRYVGSGPFRMIVREAASGQRRLTRDPGTGRITGLVYDAIPQPFTIANHGAQAGKLVALTFDDGPEEPFTAQILDSLRDAQVPATFFVIGANMVQYPDLVRRMVDEGHDVGSHTFFHPDSSGSGASRLRLELNAFQRLLASVTGRTTYLFRAPYGRSEGPKTQAEVEQQRVVEQAGLVVAGGDIVPRDWEGLTASEIVDHVMSGLSGNGGQVIVMHDAGGDRSATADAVPLLIERLRAEGYDFVPLSSFLGLARDEVMPPAQDLLTPLDRASYASLAAVGQALVWLFWGAIGFGVARSSVVLLLALLRRRHAVTPQDGSKPRVAIVIPAFNEELVVGDAVRAALASTYPGLHVIVVEDGSTDATAAAVQRDFGSDPRVELIRQPNGGKWSALNAAYARLHAEIVVAVDADTILDAAAVGFLVDHFADPRVGAVAGMVKVGNRHGLLPKLQALEYIAAQNIDRRAAERLNAMLVVPGAIGAWRVEAVRKVGLYSPDTVTEDADLTVAILRAGYRVVFEERAISITDATDNLRAFMKQRLRWSFGMMQTAWKHRRAARTAKGIGLFALPDLWLTGIGLGLLAPMVDVVVIGALVQAGTGLAQGLPLPMGDASAWMIAGWLALPLLDLLVVLAAFGFDRREQLSLVLLAPLQRLVYRPLLYITVYRAVGLALAGRIAGWGKLIRPGRVERPAR